MTLALRPRRVVDTIDRRVLGAFRLIDAVTQTPIGVPASVVVPTASLVGRPGEMRLHERAVSIHANRRGHHVIFSAPFFEAYTAAFQNPVPPPEVAVGPLRLRVRVDAGAHYLPQEFELDLPRRLDPNNPAASDSVLVAAPIALFRAPTAPAQDGWAVLRVTVVQAATAPPAPLPGVLVRVFRSPRGAGAQPLGEGMTDWRDRARGEALVGVSGIQRFRAGSGQAVVETDQEVVFEAMRDGRFTGAAGQVPNVAAIRAAGPDAQLAVTRPTPPVRIRAGREHVVHLTMR
jgi:hypothetical protein